MFDFIKKKILRSEKNMGIPTTENVMDNSIILHGEDPGTIPPDDNPNPLVEDIKK